MPINNGVYTESKLLESYEMDPFYRAQTAFYFRIMQESAGAHAYHRGVSIPHLQQEGKTWVVTRTHMVISNYALWPDTVTVETYPQEPWKLYFPRVCRLYNSKGEQLFQSLTHWVVMDVKTQRPIKPTSIAERFGAVDRHTHVDPNLGKRVSFNTDDFAHMITYSPIVRYSDCDFNKHVNNVIYFEWMLDSLPFSFRDTHLIAEVDISYLAQTFQNDDISVRTGLTERGILENDSLILFHEVLKTNDLGETQPVCVATTRWYRRN